MNFVAQALLPVLNEIRRMQPQTGAKDAATDRSVCATLLQTGSEIQGAIKSKRAPKLGALFNYGVHVLRGFDQFHLPVFLAMQHFDFALKVAEDKNFTIAEFSFFDCFFQRKRLE